MFGETHTNLIFDLVIPFDYKTKDGLVAEIQRRVQIADPRVFVVATVEHSFT